MSSPDAADLTFEQAFAHLEEIVARLEAGELTLDEAVDLYERGQQLAQVCGDLLDAAELRVRHINLDGTLDSVD
ncbi:MAG: exodeoxyribonuclease VII small subunit [Chloroflexi bacterium]|nr:exodeoxyribonuclease VII small subunit [Chloroflexota bacterium]